LAEDATPDPQSADAKAYGEIRAAYGEINKRIQEAVLNDEEVTGRFDADFRLVASKLKQFIAGFPESPLARSAARLLSFILERQGDPQQFIDFAGAQLKQPKGPDLINGLMAGLVHAYVGSGDFNKAVETSDALANMGVPLAQKESALYGKGVIHQYFLGDKRSAEEAYDSVLKLNPNSGWAKAITRHRRRDAIRVESQPGVRPQVQHDTQEEFSLNNYPNPGNPSTAVSYNIPQTGKVRIQVFDVLGRLVKTLVDKNQEAGKYTIIWDGRDDRGIASASGVYFSKMQFNGRTLTTKMTLVR
jgi:tetratricopeptide (TPR) repeat protein